MPQVAAALTDHNDDDDDDDYDDYDDDDDDGGTPHFNPNNLQIE